MAKWNLFLLSNNNNNNDNNNKQTTTEKAFFSSKPFNTTRNPAFAHSAHFDKHEKKAICRNLLSIPMKQSRWLL